MGLAVTKQEAFWEACGYGRIPEVKMFLEQHDIDVNWKSYTHNCCPIHVASQGKAEIVSMLLDAKCDVNARDDRDNLAIHHAAMKGHADILQMLLDAGSTIDAQDKNGWTSLINAAYWCQPEACKVLVKNHCNVHLKNKDQRNALHEACRSQSEDEVGLAEIVELLVECGCDLNSKSSDVGEADFTALMFCGYHGHAEAAKILVDADCDINAQGSNGWSALHWAADRNHIDTIKVLLNGGIDPLLKARRGEMAIDRATDNMVREVIAESMNVNGSEYKIFMETQGSNRNKLYIPSPTAANNYEDVAKSPITSTYIKTSAVFQSLQQQMNTLSTQSKTKKTKRIERKIASRIFEPPKIPEEEKREVAVVGVMDCEFDFMDEDEEETITTTPQPATTPSINSSQPKSSQFKSNVQSRSEEKSLENSTNGENSLENSSDKASLVDHSMDLDVNESPKLLNEPPEVMVKA